MSPILAVGRREWGTLFASSTGWVVATAFLLWNGFAFKSLVEAHASGAAPVRSFGEAVTAPLATSLALGLVLFVPLLSMGALAGERRAGSEELLFSLPLAELHVVLGKFAALLVPVTVLLGATLLYPLSLSGAATIDGGQLVAAWTGLVLAAAAYLAFGLWVSSRTESRVVAAVVTLVALLVGFFADQLLADAPAILSALVDRLSLRVPLDRFARGVVSTGDVVFHVATALCFLHLASRSLARRRTGR